MIHRTALDLTDVISPELVKNVQEITNSTNGVVDTGSVLMRRSGDIIFADITISLRGDTSFEKLMKLVTVLKVILKIKFQMPKLQFILNLIGKMFH